MCEMSAASRLIITCTVPPGQWKTVKNVHAGRETNSQHQVQYKPERTTYRKGQRQEVAVKLLRVSSTAVTAATLPAM